MKISLPNWSLGAAIFKALRSRFSSVLAMNLSGAAPAANALTDDEVRALTPAQIAAMSTDELNALTAFQFSILSVAQARAITSLQMPALESADLRSLSTAALAGLSTE